MTRSKSFPLLDPHKCRLVVRREFLATFKIPKVNHKVRAVIICDQRRDKEPRKTLVTNRTILEVKRILWVYRDRWTGTIVNRSRKHKEVLMDLGLG